MDELDQLIQSEEQRKSGEEGATTGTTEIDVNAGAATGTENNNANTEGNSNVPADKSTDNTQVSSQTDTTSAPDFNKIFEEISGGMFKSKDEFAAALPKFKEYDTLQARLADAEAKANQNPFADEFEQKRNELKKGGASKEQLSAFEKINDLGDLGKLDPLEAKVMKLVLVDGYKESVARRKVEQEFPLEDVHDEDNLEVMKEDLRISSKADFEALQKFKVSVSTIATDDVKLHQAAEVQNIKQQLTPVLTNFKQTYTTLGNIAVGKLESGEELVYNMALPETARQAIAQDIDLYFTENKIPVTQENYNEALEFSRMKYVYSNLQSIVQSAFSHFKSTLDLAASDKYQNLSGLPKGDKRAVATSNETDFRDFQTRVATGRV